MCLYTRLKQHFDEVPGFTKTPLDKYIEGLVDKLDEYKKTIETLNQKLEDKDKAIARLLEGQDGK